jgi:hypothetical protein
MTDNGFRARHKHEIARRAPHEMPSRPGSREPDIAQVDPADVMTLVGYFHDGGRTTVERVYRKRGLTFCVTRVLKPFLIGRQKGIGMIWRYNGIKEREVMGEGGQWESQPYLDLTEMAWLDERGVPHWWKPEYAHDRDMVEADWRAG